MAASNSWAAFYGTEQIYKEVTNIVETTFVTKTQPDVITIPANTEFNTHFGDPVPKKVKQLILLQFSTNNYIAIPERSLKTHFVVDMAQELSKNSHNISENQLVSGLYGAKSSFIDVTQIINTNLMTPFTIKIPAGTKFNTLFGTDPLPHHQKKLILKFKFNTVMEIIENCEGQPEQTIYLFTPISHPPQTIPKYAYIHIATLNNWLELFKEIIERIISSGLYNHLTQIRLGFLGSDSDLARINEYIADKPKCAIRSRGTDLNAYERITLHALREDAVNEDFYALYVHTKGVTKYGTKFYGPVKDWVDLMHHFTIFRHNDTFNAFENPNIVTTGCKYLRKPEHHYSGNIWWAKSSYIRTLSYRIGPKYLDPEMWILSGRGEFMVLFDGGQAGYFKRFPAVRYVNQPILGQIVRK